MLNAVPGVLIRRRVRAPREGQWRGRGEAFELLPPEHFGGGPVAFLQPLDVIAIRPGRRQFQIAALQERLVEIENFIQERAHGAGIEQQVVKVPDQNMFHLAHVKQRHSHQRWHTQLETATSVRLQIRVQTALLLAFRQAAPVLVFELKADVAMHFLPRLQVPPMETSPQHGVSFHDAFPGLTKSGDVQLLRQRANHLLDVHTGVRCGEAVEQHALLHRGKRVALCNVIRRPDLVLVRHIDAHNRLLREMA